MIGRKWQLFIFVLILGPLNAQPLSISEWLPSQTLFYGYIKNLSKIYEESFRFVSPEARQSLEQDTLYFANRFLQVYHLDQEGKIEASIFPSLMAEIDEIHCAVWEVNPYYPKISIHLKFNHPVQKEWIDKFTVSRSWLKIDEELEDKTTIYRTRITSLEYPFYLAIKGDYLHAFHDKKALIQLLKGVIPSENSLSSTPGYKKIQEKSQSEEGHYATLYLNMVKIWMLLEKSMPSPIKSFYLDLQKHLQIQNNVFVIGSNHFLKDPKSTSCFYFFIHPTWSIYQALRSPRKSLKLPQVLPSHTCLAFLSASETLIHYGKKIQKEFALVSENLNPLVEMESVLTPLFGEEFGIFMLSRYPFQERTDLILSQTGIIFQIKQPEILFPWLKQMEQSEKMLSLFPAEGWQEEEYFGHTIRWNYPRYAPFSLAYTCTKNSLVLAFSPEVVKSCIQAEHEGSTLANSALFKAVWPEAEVSASRLFYLDPDYFLKAISSEYLPKFPINAEKPLGVGFVVQEEDTHLEIQWSSIHREQIYLGRIFYALWFRTREFFKTELLWKCRFRLKSIHRAVELYHRQFQRYPVSFEELYNANFLSKEFPLYCPHTPTPESYLLRALPEGASPDSLLCYSNQGIWDGRNIILLNGQVRFVSEEEFQNIAKK